MGNRRRTKAYVLDTNVLLHDPSSILNFEEHTVIIPMTVLEELDKIKNRQQAVAAEGRQAIRSIDKIINGASPEEIQQGVPIPRADGHQGRLSILMDRPAAQSVLPNDLNDNKIINSLLMYQQQKMHTDVILVTKDINMRLKARGTGLQSEDYHNDQLVSDIDLLTKGYHEYPGSFWDHVKNVETRHEEGETFHFVPRDALPNEVFCNQYILDEAYFVAKVTAVKDDMVVLKHLELQHLLKQSAWGLTPRDVYQGIALDMLLDPDIHLVNLTGSAGSGKTILALATAIELTLNRQEFRRIIATRSTRGLDEDIGFLPGTEAEKMEPWLGAITDNLEVLHDDDEHSGSSIDYILQKVPIQFKSLNYIRGRSFQKSFIIIDECQNLTPHQVKTIVTRAGAGSKVICLGNLAQIDTPYLNATSSGLTYLTERFKGFVHGGNVALQGIPRSPLAEYAEEHL